MTNRDAWRYNGSLKLLKSNIINMLDFYKKESTRYENEKQVKGITDLTTFITNDTTKISWTRWLKSAIIKGKQLNFEESSLTVGSYWSFTKQWMYFNRQLNEMVYQMPQIFPHAGASNRVICVKGIGARSGFSAIITNAVPNLHIMDTGQCFPLILYTKPDTADTPLFGTTTSNEATTQHGITDAGLTHFATAYPDETITKDDIFYYVYGLLHSPEYRAKYQNNLAKQLPRIPRVATAGAFWAFSQAGRSLA